VEAGRTAGTWVGMGFTRGRGKAGRHGGATRRRGGEWREGGGVVRTLCQELSALGKNSIPQLKGMTRSSEEPSTAEAVIFARVFVQLYFPLPRSCLSLSVGQPAFAASVYGVGRNEWARISYDFGALRMRDGTRGAREGCMPRVFSLSLNARKRDATIRCHSPSVIKLM